MRIVMAAENDPAGMGIAFCRAINAYSAHSCHLLIWSQRYNFGFERDLFLPRVAAEDRFDEVRDVLAHADLFHFHILMDETATFGPLRLADFTRGKPIVHHHHGHPEFRADPERWQAKYRRLGRKFLVSTPDLARLAPEGSFVPNLVPVDDPDYTPRDFARDDPAAPVTVLQTPTRTDLKNTAELEALLDRLATAHPLRKEIVQHLPHRECLRRRRAADLVFDHLQGYYGVSSLEGLSMGLPVIAGLDAHNRALIADFAGTNDLPWIVAPDMAAVERALIALVHDRPRRLAIGAAARRFMETRWHPRRVIARLDAWYARVAGECSGSAGTPRTIRC